MPVGLTATATGPTQVNLAWNASSDNAGVAGYTIYSNGSALATVSGTTLAYTDGSVASATSYTYSVDAVDAAGNHRRSPAPPSTTPVPDTTAPSVPSALAATAPAPTQVNPQLTASTDDTAVTGYTVYRNGSYIATVAGSTLDIRRHHRRRKHDLIPYAVDAFDAAGNHSSQSTPASVTTLAPAGMSRRPVPGSVAASVTGPTQVTVTWSASTDDVGVSGYTIYRNGTVLGAVPPATLSFADGG